MAYDEEVAPSRKRKTTATADGDTREVKRRDTSASPSTSHDYCESPPAAQEIPWDMYDDVDDDDDEQQDDEFTFSPASPPLTQTTKGDEEDETAPPTLYVFHDSTVVLTPDGGSVRIPDRPANQPESPESPEPSTSHAHASNMNTEVCKIMMEESVSHIITNEWRTSSQTLEEVTTMICESITATILSPEFHKLMKSYARINISRQP